MHSSTLLTASLPCVLHKLIIWPQPVKRNSFLSDSSRNSRCEVEGYTATHASYILGKHRCPVTGKHSLKGTLFRQVWVRSGSASPSHSSTPLQRKCSSSLFESILIYIWNSIENRLLSGDGKERAHPTPPDLHCVTVDVLYASMDIYYPSFI